MDCNAITRARNNCPKGCHAQVNTILLALAYPHIAYGDIATMVTGYPVAGGVPKSVV